MEKRLFYILIYGKILTYLLVSQFCTALATYDERREAMYCLSIHAAGHKQNRYNTSDTENEDKLRRKTHAGPTRQYFQSTKYDYH